ncbi:Mitochondrial import inner membrane translocase subunit tim22 [Basidiobolus ranarum]|uniref:Mitochondrial import inner membrane translocase subunit TIM22 n=1 Tax=Basidiobolus ranarum TaxID=34480 RepID=A0ABR2WGS2_9FUNG
MNGPFSKEPTPKEVALIHSVMESCPFKFASSAAIGFALGGVFGIFMSSMDFTPPEAIEQPTRVQLRNMVREMGKKSYSTAKNFAVVGAIYSGTECIIEGYRAKNDLWNSVSAGCITGGILAAQTGPRGVMFGCGGFAAFSAAIDYFLRDH